MMDFVEDDEGLPDEAAERTRVRRDLLVGHGHAVDIGGQRAFARGPFRVEMNVKLLGSERPLEFQMLRRDDNNHSSHLTCDEGAPDSREGERRLTRARCRDGEKA